MPETINIIVRNTTSGILHCFLCGRCNDRLCIIQSDGRTQYFPQCPGAPVQSLAADCTICVGPPGATKTLQVPHLSAARLYFSVDTPLQFFLNPGPALVEPSATNPSDPNIAKNWAFCEFTFNEQQLYSNISYVDFVSLPVSLALTNRSGKTQVVQGLPRDGLDIICAKLQEQHQVDGAPWDQLIVKGSDGRNLRVLSPNLGRVGKDWLFSGFYEGYVSRVWEKYKKEPLTVDTQCDFGPRQGRVTNELLTFEGMGTFAKPSTGDIFSNSTGPFRTDTEAYRALTPRIAAAFNRSELLLTSCIPGDPNLYYKDCTTDHYSRIVHEVNLDGRGYTFPYDDVAKSGCPDVSGAAFDPNPSILTVTVGGTDCPEKPPLDARSHIRAEHFTSQNGVKTEVTSDVEAGHNVGWIGNGDWIAFDKVDFGNYGLNTFHARVASGQGSGVTGKIEVRLHKPDGATIASVEVGNTGGWQSWTDKRAELNTPVSGVHAVYLVFTSGRVEDFTNINWYTFERGATTDDGCGPFKTVGYYVNWAIYGRKFKPQDLPADQLTHVNYAFGNVQPDGTVFLTDTWADTDIHFPPNDSWNEAGSNCYGCLKQLYLLKKRNRKLKVLLSIGGWTYSGGFPGVASSPQGRQRFAQTAVQLVKDCGFDGVDIDWEYPADANQAQDFVDLLRELRSQLDAYSAQAAGGYRFLMTIACPAGPSNYQKLKLPEMDKYLDFWNLMAYDMAGSWDPTSGHQANLYRCDAKPLSTRFCAADAIDYYLCNGVPASKLVLGMPLYGRAFCNTAGPGEPYTGVGGADPDHGSWEAGVWDYKALPRPGANEHFDPAVVASWSYDANARTMVSYDTVECVRQKCEYIKAKKLGGAMWWETSGDRACKDEGSLIAVVVGELAKLDQEPNCLSYQQSKYDNIRNGCPGE